MDHTLYFHAAIPATLDMDLAETKGLKGKGLFDFVQRDLKRIGQFHKEGTILIILLSSPLVTPLRISKISRRILFLERP